MSRKPCRTNTIRSRRQGETCARDDKLRQWGGQIYQIGCNAHQSLPPPLLGHVKSCYRERGEAYLLGVIVMSQAIAKDGEVQNSQSHCGSKDRPSKPQH